MKVSELFEAESIESLANAVYSAFANAPEARGCDKKRPEKEGDGMVVEFRYWGDWEVPEDEEDDGDYDWKVPTAKSRKAFDAILDPLKKKYPGFDIHVDGGEKCYTTFFIKPKKGVKEGWEAELARSNREKAKFQKERERAEKALNKPPRAPRAPKFDYAMIYRKVINAISNSFPDGDPIDSIAPMLKRMGVPDYDTMKVADKAMKMHGGGSEKKGVYKYLADMWDQSAADALHDAKIMKKNDETSDSPFIDYDKDGNPKIGHNPWK